MQAIATAMARAIAEVTASCTIQGDTTACVVSEADIQTTAEVRSRSLFLLHIRVLQILLSALLTCICNLIHNVAAQILQLHC